jgi:hypothetical protein
MSDTPPDGVRYARYRRPDEAVDPEPLQALADGYFGLSYVFVANILIMLPLGILSTAHPTSRSGWLALEFFGFLWLIIMCTAIALLSYRPIRRIGEGMGWPPGVAVASSVLMGVNSVFCCGVLGYAIMQSIASRHMAQVYKLRIGLLTTRKHVQRQIDELRAERLAEPPMGHVRPS